MIIGYVRVSTQDQNTMRQEKLMEELGVEKLFLERLSAKDTQRPELKSMLEFVREGDIVRIESYSRLARNTRDLLEIVETLRKKNVALVSQKENIDTSTPSGELMMTMFAGLAQFERQMMLERQREGIAIAKANGKYKGRKPIAFDEQKFSKLYKQWKSGELMAVEMRKKLGLSHSTFYRKVKEYEKSKTK